MFSGLLLFMLCILQQIENVENENTVGANFFELNINLWIADNEEIENKLPHYIRWYIHDLLEGNIGLLIAQILIIYFPNFCRTCRRLIKAGE